MSEQVSSDRSYEAQLHDLRLNPEEEKNGKVALACKDVPAETPAESAPFHVPDDVGCNLLDILKTSLNPSEEKCRYVYSRSIFLFNGLLHLVNVTETRYYLSCPL